MPPDAQSSVSPLGTNGDQRRRFLFHHLPLAVASTLILGLFATVQVFDASAYRHGDIVTGTFPKGAADTEEGGSHQTSHHEGGAQTRRTDHSGHHGRPMGEGSGGAHLAEAGSIDRRGQDTRLANHAGERGDRRNVALSRSVQQFTVATGYLGLGLLAVTLLLGPANLLFRRRNPVSSYLRRDVGIWTAIFSGIHATLAVVIHVSHGSGLTATVLHFFVAEDGALLTNSFGLGNWTGLAAVAIALALLATSSDVALRTLRAKRWKWIQRLNYAVFALVILHAFFYGALLRMNSPFTRLLIVSVTVVCIGQAVGIWLWRRRHLGTAAVV
jgi:methionine sulfoxide reductase heme-binding subunit